MKAGLEFSPVIIVGMILAFIGISFFMGMLVRSSFMYEDKENLERDRKKLNIEYDCCDGNNRLDIYLWLLHKSLLKKWILLVIHSRLGGVVAFK